MTRLGMDADAVEQQGRALQQQAERVGAVTLEIDRLINSLRGTWFGRSSARFVDGQWPQNRSQLRQAAESIAGLGQSALNNASEQRRASSSPGTGGVSTPPDAGRSPGAAVTPGEFRDLAWATYEGEEHRRPSGFDVVDDEELRKLGLDESRFHTASGLDATLYRDADGHYVLAFRGTTDVKDWHQDAVGLDGISDQQFDAIMLARELREALGTKGTELTYTGHSLGGGLASLASLATGNKAVTFNAAGVSTPAVMFAVDPFTSPSGMQQAGIVSEIYLNRVPVVGQFMQDYRDQVFNDMLSPGQITAYYDSADPLSLAQDTHLGKLSIAANPQNALGDRIRVADDDVPPELNYHGLGRFASLPSEARSGGQGSW